MSCDWLNARATYSTSDPKFRFVVTSSFAYVLDPALLALATFFFFELTPWTFVSLLLSL